MTKKSLKIVIIGGVAGGASAAARARRLDEHAEITLIERGLDVSFANCGLPYHIGGEISEREKLSVQTPESLHAQLAINVRAKTEAVSISREAKAVTIRELKTENEEIISYDKLILSPGASPLKPPLPGIESEGIFTLRNLQDMDRIKESMETSNSVLIAGAGFIGLEMAEQLKALGKSVHIVELAENVLPQMDSELAVFAEEALIENDIKLTTGDGISAFEKQEDGSIDTTLQSGKVLSADAVILSIGVKPESKLAADAGIHIGNRGHIEVNENLQTSDPDIYAVGDVCETVDPILGKKTAIPLGGPANRQGRAAADHIILKDSARPYPGSLGTAIVRVFDVALGMTGYSEKRLQQLNVDYGKTIISDYNHAGYYPGATSLTIKLIWDKNTKKVLGAQAAGANGVDKRLDVVATAIRGKMTIEDMEHLELAYAPPFGSAKDPVNIAAFSANNIQWALTEPAFEINSSKEIILDVRPKEMANLNPIPNAINIPFPSLRSRMRELQKEEPFLVVCAMGKMSYFASRILNQNGYKSRSLVGGWKIQQLTDSQPDPSSKSCSKEDRSTLNEDNNPNVKVHKLDATGIACPGPILKVKATLETLGNGQIMEVTASDGGFKKDIAAFCRSNNCELLATDQKSGVITARLRINSSEIKQTSQAEGVMEQKKGSTIVVFSGELDKAMAAFVIANGAVAMGGKATLFFTFWGLNVLRKHQSPKIKGKSILDRLFGWMLPKGMHRLPLSQMHMGGAGTKMMKHRMASKNLPSLPGLMDTAKQSGIRLVACSMSMEAMGIHEDELIDGVEIGGVAEYLDASTETNANLFI